MRGDAQRNLILGLSLAQLISWGSIFYTFALLIGPIEQELGIGRAQSSVAFSLALLMEGLCAYAIGRWIDRGHERVVMTLGSLLAALCLGLHAFVDSLATFYGVWIGLGVAMSAILYTPVFAVVTRRFPDDFRRAIITMTFLGGLASTVFIPLTAWLISLLGWRGALGVLAALQLLVCLPIHAVLLRGAPRSVQASGGDSAGSVAAPPALRKLMRGAPFLLVGCFIVLFMAVTAALPAHLVSLLRERGLGESWAIAVPASIGVLQVCGRLLLYFFESRFDVHMANRLIPALIPLGLVALLLAPLLGTGPAALALVLLFVLLFGAGNGMLTIVKGTAIAQYVNREHVASLNGALGVPLALARAAAPLLLGLMWQPQVGYRYGLVLMLLLCVLAMAALWQAQRRVLRPATP
ncbi:MAG: MFS transporter [Rhodoferax sp.]|jgi:MFS family permease|nr:MFS transporter [Rhodoferax sp.]